MPDLLICINIYFKTWRRKDHKRERSFWSASANVAGRDSAGGLNREINYVPAYMRGQSTFLDSEIETANYAKVQV